MKYVWSKKSMLDLFLEAEQKGEISVELSTNYQAELFRFALYNFRRRTKIGREKFINYQILQKENKLTIHKSIEVEFSKIENAEDIIQAEENLKEENLIPLEDLKKEFLL